MDEPTAGLDPQMALELMELAEQLHHNGTTIVLSTHDVDLAYAWADEIHVLKGGELIYSGEPEPFFDDHERVSMTGLVLPHTFSVNSAVQRIRGQEVAPYPRTNSQILCKMLPEGAKTGKIRVVSVTDSIPDVPADGASTGVYGSITRRLFRVAEREPDYHFNAIECCLMEAVNGKDSVLYVDASMKDRALEVIGRMEAFGKRIEVVM